MPTETASAPAPARRSPTIHEVAAALGMHKSTVSLGLSGKGNVSIKTRERIQRVAREMGYQPNPLAQRLATNAGNVLVCLCAGNLDVGITTEKILMIQKELSRAGMEAPIYTLPVAENSSASSQAAQIRQLCRQQPRALVCSAQTFDAAVYPELELYQRNGGLIVAYDMAVPLQCDQIIFDREHNAYQTARYLIERGHRHLGLALSGLRNAAGEPNLAQNARVIGFARALKEAQIELRDEWLFDVATYETGGAQLAQRFLALNERPTALCIVNDYMALAFMSEVMRAGVRVPGDLSLIGHDNQPVAAYCPVALTCATQPQTEIARAVISCLNQRLNGSQDAPQTVTIRGEIVERHSVSAPRE